MRTAASVVAQSANAADRQLAEARAIPIGVPHLKWPRARAVLAPIGVAVAYYLTARLGAALAMPSTPVSALWAPNAILLAALVLARRRTWWIYLALILPAHLLAQLPGPGVSLAQVSIQYVVNCSTALIGAFGLSALAPGIVRFDRVKSVLVLIAFGALLASISTSVLMSAAFVAFGVTTQFWLTATARALTNAFAILTLVPLIVHTVAWVRAGCRPTHPLRAAEGFLLAVTLATVGIAVFAVPTFGAGGSQALLYAPLPMLLWAAVRYGVVGTCSSVLLLGALATWGVVNGQGPFTFQSAVENALSVVLFLVVTCMPLLLLAAALEERKTLELARSASEARFKAIFAHNIVPSVIWQSGGRIVEANQAFFRLTGLDPRDLEGGQLRTEFLSLSLPLPVDSADGAKNGWTGEIAPAERELTLRDGRRIPVLVGACAFPGWAGEGAAYAFDLSPTRKLEEGRCQAERLHAAILASVHDQIVVLDAAGTIIEVNDSWRHFVERAALRSFESAQIGNHYLQACEAAATGGDAMAADLLAGVRDVLDGLSARRRLEISLETPDDRLWFELCIEPLRRREGGVVIIRTDITERKRASKQAGEQRQQLALLGRAAVLGELSGAFAHELNQPLTSILGNAEAALQLLTRENADLHEIGDILRDIVQDDVRAAEVIQRLRSMLARGEIQRQSVDLNQVVREVIDLARSDLMTRNVSVGLQLDPGASSVLADRIQMQQVVLNLVVNACEAMSDIAPGERKLTISTHRVSDGSSVECSVVDRGSGIEAGDTERIFQPFVTTKKHGLGLGLAICRSIIEAHGGRLWAERGVERGAVFRFTAPIDA